MSSSSVNRKLVEQSISKSAKKVIAESGLNPSTRNGSKELDHLVKRLAEQPFDSLTAAVKAGEELGQKIVELSQQTGKQNLDRAIIRQIMLKKPLPTRSSQPKPTTPQPPQVEPAPAAKTVSAPPALEETIEPEAAVPAVEEITEPIEASGDVSGYETVDESTDDDDNEEEKAVADDLDDESEVASIDMEAEADELEDELDEDELDEDELESTATLAELDTDEDDEIDDSVSPADSLPDASTEISTASAELTEEPDEDLLEEDEEETEASPDNSTELLVDEVEQPDELEEDVPVKSAIDDDEDEKENELETNQATEIVSASDDELDEDEDNADDMEVDDTTATEATPAKGSQVPPVKAGK